MQTKTPNALMSVEDLANHLNVPKRTVYSEWRKWELPGFQVGKHLRFRERDIENWLEANRVSY
ncbi:helix-turn-helix domain-containing protein [Nocardiopsis sp. FR4]|uniref:helix-turn-helix domain-containing protein n=1 Tax=Nocardiopsis sp. FR4 TaxID=2605985 RepID=UPI001356FA9F|nr:helix-turn-helix domain-containing protein [Nocardiopsis sp. FR4]